MTDDDRSSPDLPQMLQGVIDNNALDALETQLASSAEVLETVLKTRGRAMADDRHPSLSEAFAALRNGAVYGLQIRYRFDDAVWIDTLLREPEGVRLVRMKEPRRPDAGRKETHE